MGSLVFSRRKGEDFFIGEEIKILVSRVDAGVARFVIEAPKEVRILRGELYERLRDAALKDEEE